MTNFIDARVRLPNTLREMNQGQDSGRLYEQYDRVLGLSSKLEAASMESLSDEMDEAGIHQAVIHAEHEGGEDAALLNETVAETVASQSARFKGIGSINIGDRSVTEIVRQVRHVHDLGLVGLSIQPAFFNLDIDDKRLYPVYQRAEELGLVVALHTGVNYSRVHPMKHEKPEYLDQVACDFPELQLVASHGGWPWVAEYCAVARRHPTVYLEFGGIAPKYIARPGSGWDVAFNTMPNLLKTQILYGSDWPVIPPSRAVREWQSSGLDVSTLDALLHDNAERLFGF